MNVDPTMPVCIDICQSNLWWASDDGGAAAPVLERVLDLLMGLQLVEILDEAVRLV
jgi:hypothetical protein